MDLYLLYLKSLSENGITEITITDTDNDSVISSKTLTYDDCAIYLEKIPTGKYIRFQTTKCSKVLQTNILSALKSSMFLPIFL